MASNPIARLRRFFESRFSLSDNALWRVMGLLKAYKRWILFANLFLTFGSVFSGAALVSLYPLFDATLQTKDASKLHSKAEDSMLGGIFGTAKPKKEAGATSATATAATNTTTTATETANATAADDEAAKPARVHLRERILNFGDQWGPFKRAHEGFLAEKDAMFAWLHGSTEHFVVAYITVIVILYVMVGFCQFMGNYLMSHVSSALSSDLMRKVYTNVLRQEMAFFDHNTSGALLNSCFREVFQLQTMIPMLASRRVMLPVQMLVFFIALMGISVRLSILLLVLLPIVVLPTMMVTRRLKLSMQGEIENETGALDVMTQGLQGIQAIKAFGAERLEAEQLEPCISNYLRDTRKRRLAQAFIGPLVDVLNMIVMLSVFVLAMFVFPELLKTDQAKLYTFFIIVTRFYKPMSSIMTMNIQMQRARAVAHHIFALLDREPLIKDDPGAAAFPADWKTLRFDKVDLVYTIPKRRGRIAEREALNGAEFEIQRGETIALVGPNGAGKSTIVKLICRLYDPTGGVIKFDDMPLSRIRLAELRDQVCLITQHPVLFNRPVVENITFGLEGIDQARIEAAAKAVRADDFIGKLPHGYDTPIGEGGKLLSGGERQKVVLARAFVRNPSLLIFDEPTAGLDHDSTEELIELIAELRRRGMTIIWITHDREHLVRADRVFELTLERKVIETTAATR